MSLWVFVFLLATLLNLAYFTATYNGNETDRFALLAFKSNLHDPQGVLDSWNNSVHFCKWQGVTCGRAHKRVVILNLTLSGLSGSLSPHVGNLSFLKQFILNKNNFVGKIPNEIGRLFRLQLLSVGDNSFDGEIPANISHCMRLETLGLQHNKLVGEIPREVGSLTKLTNLLLSENNLTGKIPSFIGNFTSLKSLFLDYNHFGGNIPSTLGELQNPKKISLANNKLTGTVPSSIYNLSSLIVLGLYNNELVGILPQDLRIRLPQIQIFIVSNNFFNGIIPPSLSNATTLSMLDIQYNRFTGKVPNFGSLKNLEILALNNNYLGTGEGVDDETSVLIDSLINCTSLQVLQIFDNNLRGTIPNSVGNLSTQLRSFTIAMNRVYGVIPLGLGNLLNLEKILLSENQFEGQIPNDIGKLQKVNLLLVGTNQLSGQIPFSLGNMSMLSTFSLEKNKLEGTIPWSLGKCKNLLYLDLSDNNLTGTLPKQLFDASSLYGLDLSNNHLVGPIPSEIGALLHLVELYLFQNNLSGRIPTALSFCSSLVVLWLANNFLNGSIPPTLNTLGSLQYLDLSNNNLSGTVPKFLENFHDLIFLNISLNNLVGELPTQGVFANASEIFVDGNSLLCGGIPDLRLPQCKTGKSKNTRLSLLQIILISIGCFILAVSMALLSIYFWMKNKRREQSSSFSLKESFLKVSYGDLVKATDGFSSTNIIGLGSFGSVYKGILHQNEMVVAVKVLNLERYGATKSFMAECKAWRNIRHRNLLKIITSCSSTDFSGNDFKALVYEFMPNGSLERWLHSDEEKLNLRQRVDIAVDVAHAVDYLHHRCEEPIIHCDLKPSNVLLDEDMVAHVGDFGLAKFATLDSFSANQSQSVGVKGTIGYAALEYGLGNEASKNGDIYSYGILLLEMMTGKSPTDPMFSGGLNLHNYAMQALSNNFIEFVPPELLQTDEEDVAQNDNIIKDCIVSILKIGVACSVESPQDRMNLNEVIQYGLGNEASKNGDIYSYGILLLEMITGKGPTDPMFSEGLSLHNYAMQALSNNFIEFVLPELLHTDEEDVAQNDNTIKDCIVSILKIGVECSTESPQDRMNLN